jgi:hypothetical protein
MSETSEKSATRVAVETRQDKTIQVRQERQLRQDQTIQDKTRQDKTRQDQKRQDKTRQER